MLIFINIFTTVMKHEFGFLRLISQAWNFIFTILTLKRFFVTIFCVISRRKIKFSFTEILFYLLHKAHLWHYIADLI